MLKKFGMLVLVLCFFWPPALGAASGAPVVVFPLQEYGGSRNDADLPFTSALAQRLISSGNNIIGLKTVIAFMANNRIRTVGYLDSLTMSRLRRDLGAAFVLLGTVTQRKERPEPSLGLTLELVRTSDIRTVWSYVSSISTGEERRVLAIGEPQSTADLQPLLLDEIVEQWPWKLINEVQQAGAINIDSVELEPKYLPPGHEIQSRVRLRESWPLGQAPRAFFKANDQLYPAVVSADGRTYEGTWVVGEENGSFPVHFLLEWPHYGRTESALLGNYWVDGTPPILDVTLQGTKLLDGKPTFSRNLVVKPHLLVRKPLARWRLAFYYETGNMVGEMNGTGDLPESFLWTGEGLDQVALQDGSYDVVVEVWDRAGNFAKATQQVEMDRGVPQVELALNRSDKGMVVDLAHDGKVPLSYWRMEMWTKEGKLLADEEGKELPVKIGVQLPASGQDEVQDLNRDLRGVLVLQDVFGNKVEKKIEDLLPKIEAEKVKEEAKAEAKKKKKGVSQDWVQEF